MKKGADFEELIAQYICADGLTLIEKAEPAVRVLRSVGKGQYLVTFLKGGVLDYQGSFRGRHVEFDCKDIKGTRLTFSRHFKRSQLARIRELVKDRALAGAVVRFRGVTANDDTLLCIPGYEIIRIIDDGGKGLSCTDSDIVDASTVLRYGAYTGIKFFLETLL